MDTSDVIRQVKDLQDVKEEILHLMDCIVEHDAKRAELVVQRDLAIVRAYELGGTTGDLRLVTGLSRQRLNQVTTAARLRLRIEEERRRTMLWARQYDKGDLLHLTDDEWLKKMASAT